MILRKLSKAIRNQDWFVVVLEVLIVVFGVYIGLQVDDWNTQRQNQATEQQYLQYIEDDVSDIVEIFESRLAFLDRYDWVIENLMQAIEAEPSDQRAEDSATYVMQSVARVSLFINSPTYQDLVSTGRLTLIGDKSLRDAVVEYFNQMERYELIIEKNYTAGLDDGYSQFIREHGFGYYQPDEITEHVYGMEEEVELRAIMLESFGRDLLQLDSPAYHLPPDDPFWDELKLNLAVRLYDIGIERFFAREAIAKSVALIKRLRAAQNETN